MLRSLLTILIVAAISGWISAGERAVENPATEGGRWIRTADGWESRLVLEALSSEPPLPAIHPGLVATLQVGVSLFFLLACPSRVRHLVAEGAAYLHDRRQGCDRRLGNDRRQALSP